MGADIDDNAKEGEKGLVRPVNKVSYGVVSDCHELIIRFYPESWLMGKYRFPILTEYQTLRISFRGFHEIRNDPSCWWYVLSPFLSLVDG